MPELNEWYPITIDIWSLKYLFHDLQLKAFQGCIVSSTFQLNPTCEKLLKNGQFFRFTPALNYLSMGRLGWGSGEIWASQFFGQQENSQFQ